MFSFGMFIWIFPLIFVGVVFSIIRRLYRANRRPREMEPYNPEKYGDLPERTVTGRLKEGDLFKIAQKYKGRITVSDIVLETGMGIKEAEAFIEPMVDGLHIRMEVNDKGFVVYEFPEIIARFEGDPGL